MSDVKEKAKVAEDVKAVARPPAPQDHEGHKKALESAAKKDGELKALESKISKHGFKTLDHHKEEAAIHAKYR